MTPAMELIFGLFALISIRYFMVAGLFFYVFYVWFNRAFAHMKIQHKEATKQDFLREIGHSVQNIGLMALLGFIFLYTPVIEYTKVYTDMHAYPLWYMPLSVLLALVVHDAYFYWMHKTVHHPSLFKTVHLLHHRSTNPSPWTSYSFHILEAVAENAVFILLVFLMPLHPLAIAAFIFIAFLINVYGHLGYEVMPKWFRHTLLFEFINTSVYHNMHHHKFKGNYGLYFRFWDRLMKTEHPDYVKEYDKLQQQRFGVRHVRPSWFEGYVKRGFELARVCSEDKGQ